MAAVIDILVVPQKAEGCCGASTAQSATHNILENAFLITNFLVILCKKNLHLMCLIDLCTLQTLVLVAEGWYIVAQAVLDTFIALGGCE